MSRQRRRKRHGLLYLLLALVILAGGTYGALRWYYPLRYEDTVMAASREEGISPSLIYAVIHTESGFRETATSSASARGLMQLTQIAFEEAQQQRDGAVTLGMEALDDPTVNVTYGVYVLRRLIDRFDDTDVALAAYNAGQSRVAAWLKDPACSDDGMHLTHIPYPETQHYIERVRQTQERYKLLYRVDEKG